MNTEMLNNIKLTLETIDVHGKINLAKLLGCINALDELIKEAEANGNTDQ